MAEVKGLAHAIVNATDLDAWYEYDSSSRSALLTDARLPASPLFRCWCWSNGWQPRAAMVASTAVATAGMGLLPATSVPAQ